MQLKEREPTKEERAALAAIRIFRGQNNYTEALAIAQAALGGGATHPWIFQEAARAAAQLGKRELALGYADAAIGHAKNLIKAHYNKAETLILLGDFAAGLQFFADYAALMPENPEVARELHGLSVRVTRLSRKAGAGTEAYRGKALATEAECAAVLDRIYQNKDWSIATVCAVLQWYQRHDLRQEATQLLSDWAAYAPADPNVYIQTGAYWLGQNRLSKALKTLRAGLKKFGYDKNATEMVAAALERAGAERSQEAWLAQWCATQPQEDSAFSCYANFLMQRGRLAEAATNCAKALALQPQNNHLRFQYLLVQMTLAQDDTSSLKSLGQEVKRFAQPAVLAVPNYSYLVAKYYYQQGDFYAARQAMLPALKKMQQEGSFNGPLSVLYLATATDIGDIGISILSATVPTLKLQHFYNSARRLRAGQMPLNDNDPEEYKRRIPGPKISAIYRGYDTAPVNRLASRVFYNTRPDDPP